MKILLGDLIAIQKSDIAYLKYKNISVPDDILLKVYISGICNINEENKYEFLLLEGKEVIEFFKSLDWIINYDDIKDLSNEQIIQLCKKIERQKNKLFLKFNNTLDKKNNMHLFDKCELLDFKIHSLKNFLLFNQGYLNIVLPQGVNYPSELTKNKKIVKKYKNYIFNKNNEY